jgi:ABC-2 type transport system ATP-binding protein
MGDAEVPVVRAQGVRRSWGRTVALDGVTVEIGRGITGLLGPNGAGKTSFLSLVLGLAPPDEGQLEVLGLSPRDAGPAIRTRLGYAPEYDGLPPDVRAQDLVRHVAELHGVTRRDAIERASHTLVLLGLGEERFRAIGTLSTGQKQRVKVAQAVAHSPDLVLLDEPTNGLDPLQRDEMLQLIRQLGGELGFDVIISSHLLHEIERICDAVVVIRDGRVAASRRLSELRGERREILVEVDRDAAGLVASLRADGLDAEALGPTEILVRGGEEALDPVRDRLADAGIGLRQLRTAGGSLEELFLELGRPDGGVGVDEVPAAGADRGRSGEGQR